MNRRGFLKSAGAVTASRVVGGAQEQTRSIPSSSGERAPDLHKAESAPRTRQIVVILGESVRFDMLNCNCQRGLKTPSLDRLAASGMRFTRGYDCQPVCSPARSAVVG